MAPPPGDPSPDDPPPVATIRQTIAQNAAKYKGDTSDQIPGFHTNWGTNSGDSEWCSDYASWIWGGAHAETDGLDSSAGDFVANYGQRHPGTVHNTQTDPNGYTPQRGDAVVFSYGYEGNTKAKHVAIVESVNTETHMMTIINGNGTDGKVTEREMSYVLSPEGTTTFAPTDFVNPVGPGGVPLTDAPDYGVGVGPDQLIPATAQPASLHEAGGFVSSGSDSVFMGPDLAPLARQGDRTSDGGYLVDQSDEGVYSG